MSKKLIIKNKKKVGLVVSYSSASGERLSEKEVYDVNSGKVSGFVQMEVVDSGKRFDITYDLQNCILLTDKLKDTMKKHIFVEMLKDITSLNEMLEKFGLSASKVLTDCEYVMYNEKTGHLQFIYVPVHGFESVFDLKKLILDIVEKSLFSVEEDSSYVPELISLLRTNMFFPRLAVVEYVARYSEVSGKSAGFVCPICHSRIGQGMTVCVSCGYEIKAENQDKPVYLVGSNTSSEQKAVPELIRVKNGKHYKISSFPFSIGKDSFNNMLAILDNPAVSRNHAIIENSNSMMIIEDLGTTNGTYVKGSRIKRSELKTGEHFYLADEEFIIIF